MRYALALTCLPLLLVMGWTLTLFAQDQPAESRIVPEIEAFRINPHPPTIDGNLDDPVWQHENMRFASKFTQVDPDEGKAATESTLVAVAYDDEALYLAFWCYDSQPEKIYGQLVRRDRSSPSDHVTVRVDPYHDHQCGNAFEISVAGVQRDCRYFDDVNSDMSWDAVWEADVQRQPWGWSAEYRIPFHCLRFNEKDVHTWGIDLKRYISRKGETDLWAFVPQSEGGFVSNFGHLTGLQGLNTGSHLEIMPYVVSSAETEPKSLGNPDGRDYLKNAGFDLKYALSSNLILDATINPDFGQVELDQPVLNLSYYETWFSEKRPFFLEGANLFSTDFTLFYSRRIGRAPYRNVQDEELAYYTDYPNATTILGASKITGKLSSGTSIALLTAITDEEKADYAVFENYQPDTSWVGDSMVIKDVPMDTIFRTGAVEPMAGYSVLRIKQDVLNNSHVGGMLTLASQDAMHPAVTGSVDWRLCTNNNSWAFRGQTVFSRVNNANTGFGLDLTLEKTAGQHVRGSTGIHLRDPNLDLNRLGYLSRNNMQHCWGWVQYRTSNDWWIIRNSWNNFNIYSSWNYDGINYEFGGNYNNYIEFKNFWSMNFSYSVQAEKYSDLETRGNGLWVWPVYPTSAAALSFYTDGRKMLSFGPHFSYGTDRGGTHWGLGMDANLKPKSNMEFSGGLDFHRYNNATRWVSNVWDSELSAVRSVFGDLDRDVVGLYASASILVHRNLSFQLSAEGLMSGLDYENYRYYLGDGEYSDPITFSEQDYNYTALNSTLLMRWEYSPGSTIYLVWTRSRPEVDYYSNRLDFGHDFKRFFNGSSYNVFLVKMSYWLNI
jgi:hypothetical protein